ncbi:MAG: hypothetical protein JSS00_00325, partial [Proteobacteria bacterium]|nr:hypothetical protein [Pseudomonadota bacterium]
MVSSAREVLKPVSAILPRLVREHEVLRVSGLLGSTSQQPARVLDQARREALVWVEKRIGTTLSPEAWKYESFEHLSGGRNCIGIRLQASGADVWALRAEDPDKEIPGRVWTTEIVTALGADPSPRFSLRLVASSLEATLEVDPHTPGLVQQLADTCGLRRGPYLIGSEPTVCADDAQGDQLAKMLTDPTRSLPVIAISLPESPWGKGYALINADALARATLGLAHVFVVDPSQTWRLTERFGKRLSTYGGAARIYLPGFTEDSDPYAHKLFLPGQLRSWDGATYATRMLRLVAAQESVRRTKLGADVLAFSDVRNAALKLSFQELERKGAPDREQLEAARHQIAALEKQVDDAKAS